MKKIPLTRGYEAIVDDVDYPSVSQYKWHAVPKGPGLIYAVRESMHKKIYLHRDIMKLENSGQIVDHINHNCLDNRRENLRIVTPTQNQQNARRHKAGTSKYKGVYWNKQLGKWEAKIRTPSGKRVRLGSYEKEEAAADAYNKASKHYHGEYSCVESLANA